MRYAILLAASTLVFSGAADASSFVSLPAMTEKLGPSMVALPAPKAAPSIIALGAPAKAPREDIAVASIEPAEKAAAPSAMPAWIAEQIPLAAEPIERATRKPFRPVVFRGGLEGDAFATRVASPSPASAAPASASASAKPTRKVSADRLPPAAPEPSPPLPAPEPSNAPVMPRIERAEFDWF